MNLLSPRNIILGTLAILVIALSVVFPPFFQGLLATVGVIVVAVFYALLISYTVLVCTENEWVSLKEFIKFVRGGFL